jgi:hypothetical protein
MKPTDLLLPLVAAFWAFCTLLFSVTRHLNGIRDKVLIGSLKPKHLAILVNHDWKPLTFTSVFASLVFSLIALFAPLLIPKKDRTRYGWLIAALVASGCAFMAGAWWYYAPRDLTEMRKAIKSCEEAIAASQR